MIPFSTCKTTHPCSKPENGVDILQRLRGENHRVKSIGVKDGCVIVGILKNVVEMGMNGLHMICVIVYAMTGSNNTHCTVVQNSHESRRKYWATHLSIRSWDSE